MTIGLLFVIVAVIGVAAVCVWTFYPPIRAQLKGWSTIIELIGGFVYWVMGNVTGGIQDAVTAGYVPAWLLGWVPIIMFAYILMVRFRTTTPVGVKP